MRFPISDCWKSNGALKGTSKSLFSHYPQLRGFGTLAVGGLWFSPAENGQHVTSDHSDSDQGDSDQGDSDQGDRDQGDSDQGDSDQGDNDQGCSLLIGCVDGGWQMARVHLLLHYSRLGEV
ncbi:hypothetical protein ABVK25_011741 [Lepraria finkii]|uniref:Uncharacterized protein n=1 Tax=Lepraria finkii TaxID=1340010 RepID=A0ABR4AM39_9LECA